MYLDSKGHEDENRVNALETGDASVGLLIINAASPTQKGHRPYQCHDTLALILNGKGDL